MRFVQGAIPAPETGENPDSTTTLWVRDTPPRPLDFAALTSLCDVFFPRVFLRRGQYMPAGTVSLTIYFHARSQHFGKGYFDQSGELWSSDGNLLATTHQLVYFKG